MLFKLKHFLLCLFLCSGACLQASGDGTPLNVIPRSLEAYADAAVEGLWPLLQHRVVEEPFNAVALVIFLLAIVHTFLSGFFRDKAHVLEEAHKRRSKEAGGSPGAPPMKAVLFHFLGEIEAIFGLWAVPLLFSIFWFFGWGAVVSYMDSQVHFTEPLFVMVIMAIASTRPVIYFSEKLLAQFAKLGGSTPAAWWCTLLAVAPFLGSFITEPAAMTIAALLLGQQFFVHGPSRKLKYATLGLLFVNISVGGTLSHFAAPPILMVAGRWGWSFGHVFKTLGTQAVVGVLASTLCYFLFFRKELLALKPRSEKEKDVKSSKSTVPWWIQGVHLLFLAWTVFTLHHIPLFLGGFLFFLAFKQATQDHQDALSLRSPLLVAFFLAGLVVHGGVQSWWIAPVLSRLGELPLFIGATVLTSFNDNAAITYLASLVPSFANNPALQHAVVSGAVAGGGLTVIANAPNPAGQSILSSHFGKEGVSPVYLFLGALVPTVIIAILFNTF